MNAKKVFVNFILVMTCCAVTCGSLPYAIFYASYGRMPLDGIQDPFKVPMGSTTDEVISTLGPPHKRHSRIDGTELWIYYADLFGFIPYQMRFDAAGRLDSVWW
jgi:hypothetical protein